MLYICSIVSKRIIDVPEYVFLTKSFENVIPNKPVLVIGIDKVKETFPEVVLKYTERIIDIDRSIFWSVSPFEKRTLLEEDLDTFYDYSVNFFVKSIQYTYIDVLALKRNKIKNIISFFNTEKKLIFLDRDNSFLYVYYQNKIMGFNMELLSLLNIKKNNVINKILNNELNVICDNKIVGESDKDLLIRLKNDKKYLPLFNCNFLDENLAK